MCGCFYHWSRDRLFGTFGLVLPIFFEIITHMAKWRSISHCAHGRVMKVIIWPQIRHWSRLFLYFDRDILFGTFFPLGCFNDRAPGLGFSERNDVYDSIDAWDKVWGLFWWSLSLIQWNSAFLGHYFGTNTLFGIFHFVRRWKVCECNW